MRDEQNDGFTKYPACYIQAKIHNIKLYLTINTYITSTSE